MNKLIKLFFTLVVLVGLVGLVACGDKTGGDKPADTEVVAEVTFFGNPVQKLSSKTLNEATIPNVSLADGETLLGWAYNADSEVADIATGVKITYETVKDKLTNNKVTLYPVVKKADPSVTYDLVVAIWTGDGTNVYITNYEVEQLKAGFNEVLKTAGKEVSVGYLVETGCSSNEFNAKVNGNDKVGVAVSGANMASDSADPSINLEEAAGRTKVGANHFNNTKRYVGVVLGYGEDELAMMFYNYMVDAFDATAKVTFVLESGNVEKTIKAVSSPSIELEAPTKEGLEFAGWALSSDGDVVVAVGAELNYATLASNIVDGELTLYPIFVDNIEKFDLVVSMLVANSSNTFITADDVKLIQDSFMATLVGTKFENANISWDAEFKGSGANFVARVNTMGNVDIVIGASNLISNGGLTVLEGTEGKLIVNPAISNSTRYVFYNEACATDHKELADLFYTFLTYVEEKNIEVTLVNGEAKSVTNVSNVEKNVATLEVVAPEGKTFAGWALTVDGEVVVGTTTDITYSVVEALAVDGKVTLYAVFNGADTKLSLVVAINTTGTSATYISDDEVELIKSGFTAYLTGKGYKMENVEITWKTKGGVNASGFGSWLAGETDVDFVIAGNNMTDNGVVAAVVNGATLKGKVVTPTLTNTSRYAAVCAAAANNQLAVELYNYLTTAA